MTQEALARAIWNRQHCDDDSACPSFDTNPCDCADNCRKAAAKAWPLYSAAQADNARLRSALEPFAAVAAKVDPGWDDKDKVLLEWADDWDNITVGDLRRAATASNQGE